MTQRPIRIRRIQHGEGPRAVEIWRRAVEATHHFLVPGDIEMLDARVRDYLPDVPLWVAVDPDDRPIGFMGLSEAHLDSLFIDPAWHGVGVGRALINHALALHATLTTEVNEQNEPAMTFYRRMGFVAFKRTPTDEEGMPYPLVYLRHQKSGGKPSF